MELISFCLEYLKLYFKTTNLFLFVPARCFWENVPRPRNGEKKTNIFNLNHSSIIRVSVKLQHYKFFNCQLNFNLILTL